MSKQNPTNLAGGQRRAQFSLNSAIPSISYDLWHPVV